MLVYFDAVIGYVPPNGMPPAKKPILTLLKQARAFGVGLVLATQNPVAVDYKALSNAGTWMIGRLQTEQDKARLLDGLDAAAGGVDVAKVSDTISALDRREFVLEQAGSDQPTVFTTRWAMSYLRGPLTREQIGTLMADRRAALSRAESDTTGRLPHTEVAEDGATPVAPPVAEGVPVRAGSTRRRRARRRSARSRSARGTSPGWRLPSTCSTTTPPPTCATPSATRRSSRR